MSDARARSSLADTIRTCAIVTILAIVVWLFAEAESLGQEQVPARIVVGTPNSGVADFLVISDEFDGEVTLDVRGGKAALNQLDNVLQRPLRLEPGRGLPASDGAHDIDLLDALKALPRLTATGATIEYVRPPRARVRIERLVERSLPISIDLPVMSLDTPPTVTPTLATLRITRSLEAAFGEGATIRATVGADALRDLGPGPHAVPAELKLPAGIAGERGVTLLTQGVTINLVVSSDAASERYPAVPVQILLPPIEADDWRITLHREDQVLAVELSGPRGVLDALRDEGGTPVAVLTLSDIELASGITEKAVSFTLIRDGRPTPLPPSVGILPERDTVRFTVESRRAP